jgi:transcriptional regulator with XRE-family HTH domain
MVDKIRIKQYLEELDITELNHIKIKREELGISVENLAKACDISVGELSMVENFSRIPNQIIIIKILRGFKKFDINPHDVFTFY